MSTELMARKTAMEIVPPAFIDHHAFGLPITISNHDGGRRRGRWKMNPILMKTKASKERYEKRG